MKDIYEMLIPGVGELIKKFSPTHEIEAEIMLADNMVIRIFRELFASNYPDYQFQDGTFSASRSNLTYHTAMCLHTAANAAGFDCIFETAGKRDAVIRSKRENPVVLMFAEWEWSYLDVFGKGQEIEKLAKSLKAEKMGSAFLFTYVPAAEYPDYLARVAEEWAKYNKKYLGKLNLSCVLLEPGDKTPFSTRIRSVDIDQNMLIFWEDVEIGRIE